MEFDWNSLRHFLAVARTGRLTMAAARLGTDHATVSRRVKALEEALQASLFERSPRGYALTASGEALLAHAEEMENAALRMQSEIAGERAALSGTVRFGAPDGFGAFFFAPRMGALATRFPELEVQLIAMPRIFSLSKREADLAVGLSRPKEGRLVARKLTDYSLRLYGSKTYLARNETPQALDQLGAHTIIGYIPELLFSEQLDYLGALGEAQARRIASSNLIAQMRAAAAGAGLCILPDFMAREEPRLVPVLPEETALRRTFWLIVHADMQNVPRIRAVADFIVDVVRQNREIFVS